MTLEQIIAGGGSAGLILALAYAVRELWRAHQKEDAAREARLVATETREDVWAEATKETNRALASLLEEVREQRKPYDGHDRRQER